MNAKKRKSKNVGCVKIKIGERARIVVSVNSFFSMSRLKDLKVAIIGIVNNWRIIQVNLVVLGHIFLSFKDNRTVVESL